MAIRVTNPKTKMPRAFKLASQIATYMFEEEYGECQYFNKSEKEAITKALKALAKATKRADKGK